VEVPGRKSMNCCDGGAAGASSENPNQMKTAMMPTIKSLRKVLTMSV
jgi:hypothetical protein